MPSRVGVNSFYFADAAITRGRRDVFRRPAHEIFQRFYRFSWPAGCPREGPLTVCKPCSRDVSENITDVSNSAVKTGQVASTVLTAAGELADQSHLLRQEVERYLAQLRVAS
jgi:hypothetical protein